MICRSEDIFVSHCVVYTQLTYLGECITIANVAIGWRSFRLTFRAYVHLQRLYLPFLSDILAMLRVCLLFQAGVHNAEPSLKGTRQTSAADGLRSTRVPAFLNELVLRP